MSRGLEVLLLILCFIASIVFPQQALSQSAENNTRPSIVAVRSLPDVSLEQRTPDIAPRQSESSETTHPAVQEGTEQTPPESSSANVITGPEAGGASLPDVPPSMELNQSEGSQSITEDQSSSAIAPSISASGSEQQRSEQEQFENPESAEVAVGSRHSFSISNSPGFSAEERAGIVTRRIEKILKNAQMDPGKISTTTLLDGSPSVVLDDFIIVAVSKTDASLYGQTQAELAEEWATKLKAQIKQLQPLSLRAEKLGTVSVLREHRVLLLLLQVAILLLSAFVGGEVVAYFKQPRVIGQLVAGILIGPSVLGALTPELSAVVFPVEKAQSNLLEVVSWLGVLFLLMLSGMEVNFALIKKHKKPASGAAILGSIIPFVIGLLFGYFLPEQFLVAPEHRPALSLFLGALFSVSSVPVVAKILVDMRLMHLSVGQIILTAALVQDIFGCSLLSGVALLANPGDAHDYSKILKVIIGGGLFVTALIFGYKKLLKLLEWIDRSLPNDGALLTAIAVLVLLAAATTQYLGLHVVLGAFSIGMMIGQSPTIVERIEHPLRLVMMSIFAPVFFAAAGLNVNLSVLMNPSLVVATLSFTATVCLVKIVSGFCGAKFGGLPTWQCVAVGFGINAYGAMGLIFATIGFSLGILTVDTYSIIVVMALATTIMAPPFLKWAMEKSGVDIQLNENPEDNEDDLATIEKSLLADKEHAR